MCLEPARQREQSHSMGLGNTVQNNFRGDVAFRIPYIAMDMHIIYMCVKLIIL